MEDKEREPDDVDKSKGNTNQHRVLDVIICPTLNAQVARQIPRCNASLLNLDAIEEREGQTCYFRI